MLRFTLAAILALSTQLQAQEELTTRIFDLRVLAKALGQDSEFRLELPLLSEFALNESSFGFDDEDEGHGVIDNLMEMVHSHGVLGEEEEIYFDHLSSGIVVVRARPDLIQPISDFVSRYQRRLLRAATVEIYLLDRDGFAALPRSRLSAQACRDFLDRRRELSPSVHQLRLGRRETLAASRRSSVLGAYNVEIAEKAAIANPVVRSLFEGLDISLVVDERLDGRFHLSLATRGSERLASQRQRTIPAVNRGIGAIELPTCASQLNRLSGDLEVGGALVFGSNDPFGERYLLRLKSVDPAPAQSPRLRTFAVSDLTRWLPRQALPFIPEAGVSSRFRADASSDHDQEHEAALDADQMTELMSMGGIYDGSFDGSIEHACGTFWVAASDESMKRIEDVVREVAEPLQRTLDYDLRWQLVDASDFSTMARQDIGSWAEKLENRTLLSSRVGDVAIAVTGQESAYIRDKDVEVASESSIAEPIVDGTFSGLALRFYSSFDLDGQVAMKAEIVMQNTSADIVDIPTHLDSLGSVDGVRGQRVSANPRILTRLDRWNLLMAAKVTGTSQVAVMVMKVN